MHMYVKIAGLPIIGTSASSRVTEVKSLMRRSRLRESNTHVAGLEPAIDVVEEEVGCCRYLGTDFSLHVLALPFTDAGCSRACALRAISGAQDPLGHQR